MLVNGLVALELASWTDVNALDTIVLVSVLTDEDAFSIRPRNTSASTTRIMITTTIAIIPPFSTRFESLSSVPPTRARSDFGPADPLAIEPPLLLLMLRCRVAQNVLL
jgi:hypothetical protein